MEEGAVLGLRLWRDKARVLVFWSRGEIPELDTRTSSENCSLCEGSYWDITQLQDGSELQVASSRGELKE